MHLSSHAVILDGLGKNLADERTVPMAAADADNEKPLRGIKDQF